MNRDKKGTSEPVLQLPPASNANDNSNGLDLEVFQQI